MRYLFRNKKGETTYLSTAVSIIITISLACLIVVSYTNIINGPISNKLKFGFTEANNYSPTYISTTKNIVNLYPGFSLPAAGVTVRGVLYTSNADGSITLNGTSTGAGYYSGVEIPVFAGMKLVASGCNSNSGTGCSMIVMSTGWSKKLSVKSATDTSPISSFSQQNGIDATFYVVSDTKISCYIWVNTGRTFHNEVVKPVIYS